MKPEIKEKWVNALLSKEYNQTTGGLRDSKGYCCLGVLCDLYLKENEGGEWIEQLDDNYLFKYRGSLGEIFYETYNLPRPVYEWAGIWDNDIQLTPDGDGAAPLNDSGVSFQELARLIKQLPNA